MNARGSCSKEDLADSLSVHDEDIDKDYHATLVHPSVRPTLLVLHHVDDGLPSLGPGRVFTPPVFV